MIHLSRDVDLGDLFQLAFDRCKGVGEVGKAKEHGAEKDNLE